MVQGKEMEGVMDQVTGQILRTLALIPLPNNLSLSFFSSGESKMVSSLDPSRRGTRVKLPPVVADVAC